MQPQERRSAEPRAEPVRWLGQPAAKASSFCRFGGPLVMAARVCKGGDFRVELPCAEAHSESRCHRWGPAW
jgi:hypothetical protein